jgi:hypothetical protein
MPKAVIAMRSGATVAIEGSEDEVASLVARIEGGGELASAFGTRRSPGGAKGKPKLTELVAELIEDGFFSQPKELGAVKAALEEQGHFYPVTTLSPLMLRLVRKKELRRMKDKKRWLYVG